MTRQTLNRQSGFTLPEMMIALFLLAVLAGMAAPGWSELVNSERVIATTNRLHGFLKRARNRALAHNRHVVVCGENCRRFDNPDTLMAFVDKNRNRALDPGEEIIERIEVAGLSRLQWKTGLRGDTWLEYKPWGLLYYQNGHFLLCAGDQGRKITMNWIGRTYVERVDEKNSCPPAE